MNHDLSVSLLLGSTYVASNSFAVKTKLFFKSPCRIYKGPLITAAADLVNSYYVAKPGAKSFTSVITFHTLNSPMNQSWDSNPRHPTPVPMRLGNGPKSDDRS